MAEWNLTMSEERQLYGVARDEAFLSKEPHTYLPKTQEQAIDFTPHEWVLEAMRRAYSMGRMAGRHAAQSDIRLALGCKP